MRADDPVRKGVDKRLRAAGQKTRMGDVQCKAEILRRNGVEDASELFDGHTEISNLRFLVNFVHIFDADGEFVLLRQFDNRRIRLDQSVEDRIHKKAEVVAEMEHDVFCLKPMSELDIINQVLLDGLADCRFNLGSVDERGRMETVLDTSLIPQLLDAADARGGPFVQKVVGIVAAQFNPGESVLLCERKILL